MKISIKYDGEDTKMIKILSILQTKDTNGGQQQAGGSILGTCGRGKTTTGSCPWGVLVDGIIRR